jgi:hypothetical protein
MLLKDIIPDFHIDTTVFHTLAILVTPTSRHEKHTDQLCVLKKIYRQSRIKNRFTSSSLLRVYYSNTEAVYFRGLMM